MFDKIYEPQEESFMLREEVRKFATGKVLDMGTGMGIQAQAALENANVTEVTAVDLNPTAVRYVKKLGIKAVKSDLFSKVTGLFDTIIFNAPYLPEDIREKKDEHSMAVCGGRHGWEIIDRFFSQVSPHLSEDGIILLLFSSLTDRKKVDEIISHRLFESTLLVDKRYFFENVYIYMVQKTSLLNTLESQRLEDIKFFAKGKRGIVYKADYIGKTVAVKIENSESKAVERIRNEINMLTELNRYGIGPELYFSGKNWFVMDFIEGEVIGDFLKRAPKRATIQVIKNLLNMLFELDQLGINKEEMNHPHKHVIIDKHLHPFLIDFERAKKTNNPKNVSQFVQFITSENLVELFGRKHIKISRSAFLSVLKHYKSQLNYESFTEILNLFDRKI